MRTLFPSTRLILRATAVVRRQQQAIIALQKEKREVELRHARLVRDLAEQFLISLDQPENNDEYRRILAETLGVYRDQVAVLEEHA